MNPLTNDRRYAAKRLEVKKMKKAMFYSLINLLVAVVVWIIPELIFTLTSGGNLSTSFTRPGFLFGFGVCAILATVFTFFSTWKSVRH